ncbi:MAG: hypothetical protein ACI4ON_01980 [Clostridia bacterium]
MLEIEKDFKLKDSITHTIRMSGSAFDKIQLIAEKNNISFNKVVNQLIEYGLKNMNEK